MARPPTPMLQEGTNLRWFLKAAVQGTLSLFPDPQSWNRLLQTRVTRSLLPDDGRCLAKWAKAERHICHWEEHAGPFEGATVLEIGTGWLPTVPVALALNGAARVISVDRKPLLHKQQLVAVLERVERLLGEGRLCARRPGAAGELQALLAAAPSLSKEQILERLSITPLVGDARRLDLAPGSVDFFVSNNTIEHIPADVLDGILRSFGRLASPRALASHHVDLKDHYAGFDPAITPYNFLRYTDRAWRLFNNRLHYQSRLRSSDYLALHRQTGWDVIAEEPTRGSLEALRSVPLAPRFRAYDEADLLVYDTWIVSRPARTEASHSDLEGRSGRRTSLAGA